MEKCKECGKKGVTIRTSMPPEGTNFNCLGIRWKECRYCKHQEDIK